MAGDGSSSVYVSMSGFRTVVCVYTRRCRITCNEIVTIAPLVNLDSK